MKIPTYRSGPLEGQAYRAKPTPTEEPRKPRLYDLRAWRGSGKRIGARAAKLRRSPLCERCLLDGKHVPAADVHHRTDVKAEPSLAFDLANLESLCKPCHSRETDKRTKRGSPAC